MGIPDFSGIELGTPTTEGSADEWSAAAEKATGGSEAFWETRYDRDPSLLVSLPD